MDDVDSAVRKAFERRIGPTRDLEGDAFRPPTSQPGVAGQQTKMRATGR
jgi:hypothetical protein